MEVVVKQIMKHKQTPHTHAMACGNTKGGQTKAAGPGNNVVKAAEVKRNRPHALSADRHPDA